MKTILVSGAGVAGPTLAYWLLKWGFEPTIVEQSPSFRTGGYIIDFWGAGFDVAERMDLIGELRQKGYNADEVRFVGKGGEKLGGFSADIFRKNLGDRFLSIQRGELAAAIYDKIANDVETIFGDSIHFLREENQGLLVSFEKGSDRHFDLVIGADGLHSVVRQHVFGPEKLFERSLGYCAAAFSTEGYKARDENAYVAYSSPGKQIARFSLRDDKTVFFLIFKKHKHLDALAPRATLEAVFAKEGWESADMLNAMRDCKDLYFDSVSQIQMPAWSRGRVSLVGDAAYCVSLLAGQGSSLAMVGSYILAGELKKSPDNHKIAFERYESLLRPLIAQKQQAARKFASWFAPDADVGIFLRNQVTKLFNIPIVARHFVKGSFADQIDLPDYGSHPH